MPRVPNVHRRPEAMHIDMVPMVDCIMVLLIFLMISSAFVRDPGIEVEKPNVSGGEGTDRNALLIAIGADNRIFFEGQELQPEQIMPALKRAALGREQVLVIVADRGASHGAFAAVYAEAKRAGIPHVQFATAQGGAPR